MISMHFLYISKKVNGEIDQAEGKNSISGVESFKETATQKVHWHSKLYLNYPSPPTLDNANTLDLFIPHPPAPKTD